MFRRSLFVLLLMFFIWPLCCLSFCDIRVLINPLVSPNSSSYKTLHRKLRLVSMISTEYLDDLMCSGRTISYWVGIQPLTTFTLHKFCFFLRFRHLVLLLFRQCCLFCFSFVFVIIGMFAKMSRPKI